MTSTLAHGTSPSLAPRLLAPAPGPAGPPPRLSADALIELAWAGGLTGRGGAGFPLWRKLAVVAAGREPVVIGNGAEGEPASRKDAVLLDRRPDLVLDGLAVVAGALSASEVYLQVPAASAERLQACVDERRRTGLDTTPVQVRVAADAFIAGEESAAVSWLAGKAAAPSSKPPMVVQRGLHNRPTLVSNVETLAHLAQLVRHGPEWFGRAGTAQEPGTLLATVSGAVARPGVLEVAAGLPLTDVLARAGGITESVSAVLVGGYAGGWISAHDLPGAVLSRPALAALGASLGAGVVVALPASVCGLAENARVAAYLARQSAGQCGPCLNGLPRLAELVSGIAAGRPEPAAVAELHRIAGLVEGRGACHHPDGTVRFLRSALRVFSTEVDAHLAGRCTATSRRAVLPV